MDYRELAKWVSSEIITEGGNVFPTTSSISQDLIPETISHLHENVLAPLGLVERGKDWEVLGSVGKKSTPSNDIDIAVVKPISEIETFIKDSNYKYRNLTGLDVISLAYPIAGLDKSVQIDLMPTDNLPYSIWSYHSPHERDSNYSGTYRNAMLEAIASEVDKQILSYFEDGSIKKIRKKYYSYANGLMERIDTYKGKRGKPVKKPITLERTKLSKDPKRISEYLLGEGVSREDTDSFESIYKRMMSEEFPHKHFINDIKEKCRTILKRKKLPIPHELKEAPDKFNRHMKSKRIVNMPKIPHIENMTIPQIIEFFADGEYEFSEKVDGANFSFGVMEGQIYGKSKKDKVKFNASDYYSNSHINDVFNGMGNLLTKLEKHDFQKWHAFNTEKIAYEDIQIFGEIFYGDQVNAIKYDESMIGCDGCFVVFGVYGDGEDLSSTVLGQKLMNGFIEMYHTEDFPIRRKELIEADFDSYKVNRLLDYIETNMSLLNSRKRDVDTKDRKTSARNTITKLLKSIKKNVLEATSDTESMLGGNEIEGIVITNKKNGKMIKIVDMDKFGEINAMNWADRNQLKNERRKLFMDMIEHLNSDVLKMQSKRESTLKSYLTIAGKSKYTSENELLAVLLNDIQEEINIDQSLSGIKSVLDEYVQTLFQMKERINSNMDEKNYNDTVSMFDSELSDVIGLLDSIADKKTPQMDIIKYMLGNKGMNELKEKFM
jgi:hypothetical protein